MTTIVAKRCQGVRADSGAPCKLAGTDRGEGWVGCGHHRTPPPRVEEHPARALLAEAMNHPSYSAAPGAVRYLIEYAWVELGR